MRMCAEHWSKLRVGVQDRGLWHLVSQSGEEALQQTMAALEEEHSAVRDPLLAAYWAICGRAIEEGGLYLLEHRNDGGEYCPLCELESYTEQGMAQNWIDGCLDAQRRFCIEEGIFTDNTQ